MKTWLNFINSFFLIRKMSKEVPKFQPSTVMLPLKNILLKDISEVHDFVYMI